MKKRKWPFVLAGLAAVFVLLIVALWFIGEGEPVSQPDAEDAVDVYGDVQTPQAEPTSPPAEQPTLPPAAAEDSGGYLPYPFSTKDVYGNAVTEETLGEKELFFIHFWGTWCPPCVAEMPDLASLSQQYSDRVGFLGLLDDFDNTKGAKKILENAGVPDSFIMIDAYISGVSELLSMCNTGYVPTTVILDIDGNTIGEPLIGAYGTSYADILDSLLD